MEGDAPQRDLAPDADAALTAALATIDERICRWESLLRRDDVGPLDRNLYEKAAQVAIERGAADLAADPPSWLLALLGERPETPAEAQLWDDSVREVAGHRLRHGIAGDDSPLGRLDQVDPQVLSDLSGRVLVARRWLQANAVTEPADLIVRSASELAQRSAELDVILASAPADQRHLISRLQSGDDGAMDDLQTALRDQSSRRTWILEHWPHVVEKAEVARHTPAVLEAEVGDAVVAVGPQLTP